MAKDIVGKEGILAFTEHVCFRLCAQVTFDVISRYCRFNLSWLLIVACTAVILPVPTCIWLMPLKLK